MLSLVDSAIHLWYVNQADFDSAELEAACLDWLRPQELQRYHRYFFDRDRKQFLLGRMLMRRCLSFYREIAPGDWDFVNNSYGKPALAEVQQLQPLYFNLSHSGGHLVLALSLLEQIGVDIEDSAKPRRVAQLAARYFAAREVDELLRLPQSGQLDRFYELWTLKEAYIKACGLGLAIPLQQFSYLFSAGSELQINFDASFDDSPRSWEVWQLDPGAGLKLGLAARSGEEQQISSLVSRRLHSLNEFREVESVVLRSSSS
jgi:4'-phosphopantetheinyl transferase